MVSSELPPGFTGARTELVPYFYQGFRLWYRLDHRFQFKLLVVPPASAATEEASYGVVEVDSVAAAGEAMRIECLCRILHLPLDPAAVLLIRLWQLLIHY